MSDAVSSSTIRLDSNKKYQTEKDKFSVAVTSVDNAAAQHGGCFDACRKKYFNLQKKSLVRQKDVEKKKVMNSNEIFDFGGSPNEFSPVAKQIYQNVYAKGYQREVNSFLCNSHGKPKLGLNFYKERSRCLKEKKLFEDLEFPANDESLFMKRIEGQPYSTEFQAKHNGYVWKRPAEIVANPQFIVADQSRFDVNQGALSDCCLSACASTLTIHEQLLYRVVPLDQSFTEDYAGIFHFQFWHYGEWVDVVIDDRLPTRHNFLVFMRSEQRNEFWSALLEKAYAKLNGSYETIADGSLADIMEDMTGGIVENFVLSKFDRYSLHKIIDAAYTDGAMITSGIDLSRSKLDNGLVPGHAYGITGMAKVKYFGGEVWLIRLRNPWGNAVQWTGPFSDKAPEWNYVSDEDKNQLLNVKDDGEFWMVWDDFLQQFTTLHICMLGQECLREVRDMSGEKKKKTFAWLSVEFHGEWSPRKGTAGGLASGNMTCNPQYSIRIPNSENNNTSLLIEVMQKHEKETKGRFIKKVGFAMIPRKRKLGKVEEKDLHNNTNWTIKPCFMQERQIMKRVTIPAGDYCLIVSTENGNQEGEFLLRFLSNKKIDVK